MSVQPPSEKTEYNKVRMTALYGMAEFRFRSAADFAQLAARSAIIANGGALVAALTFLGTVNNRAIIGGVGASMLWFVAGLVFALLAVFGAYQTQSSYGLSQWADADMIYFHHVSSAKLAAEQTAESDKARDDGIRWEWWSISYFILALAAFVGGSWCGLRVF